MRISDWSSDVCSSDLDSWCVPLARLESGGWQRPFKRAVWRAGAPDCRVESMPRRNGKPGEECSIRGSSKCNCRGRFGDHPAWARFKLRSEEHTSELQSLMRISYAVFCLKKKTIIK